MKTKNVSDAELLMSARDALGVLQNCVDALTPSTDVAFILPLLNEAQDASRVVNAAVTTLRDRAAGVKPPKVGD